MTENEGGGIAPLGGSLVPISETAMAAGAARAKAEIEAAYAIAIHRPRSYLEARKKILAACGRPRFAESAIYALPRRSKNRQTEKWETVYITGPTIRCAEEILRALGNIRVTLSVVFEDAEKRICALNVTDLENNVPIETSFVVAKTVERRQLRDGEKAVEIRVGSEGSPVYIVAASEADVAAKQNAAASKAIRNAVIRLFPSDLMEEALETIAKTQAGEHKADSAKAVRNLVDGFGRLGVTLAQIAEYLGHPADTMTEAEWSDLKRVGTSIRDGETTWAEVMEARAEEAAEKRPAKADVTERTALIERLQAARINRPEVFVEACKAIKIPADPTLERLSLPALRQLEKALAETKGGSES